MSKTSAFSLALAALVIGAVFGGWAVSRFWGHFTGGLSNGSMAAEAGTTVGILKSLRSGKSTTAVELLEIKLDGALVGLGAGLSDIPAPRRDPLHIRAIQSARDYRSEFPRTNDSPEVAEAIAKAFTLLNGHSPQ